MMKKLLFVILSLFIVSSVSAQTTWPRKWVQTYGDPDAMRDRQQIAATIAPTIAPTIKDVLDDIPPTVKHVISVYPTLTPDEQVQKVNQLNQWTQVRLSLLNELMLKIQTRMTIMEQEGYDMEKAYTFYEEIEKGYTYVQTTSDELLGFASFAIADGQVTQNEKVQLSAYFTAVQAAHAKYYAAANNTIYQMVGAAGGMPTVHITRTPIKTRRGL